MSRLLAVWERWGRWALAALAVVFLVASCQQCGARRDAEDLLAKERMRVVEAEQLLRDGVASFQPVEDLRPALEAAYALVDGLEAQVAELQRKAPGARVVAVMTTETKPAAIAADVPATPTAVCPSNPGEKPEAVCVVATGDQLKIRVGDVLAETKGGNLVVQGTAELVRTAPAPAQLLLEPWAAELTEAHRLTPAPSSSRGWGAGLWGLGSGAGWAAGGLLEAPPWRVLGVDLELSLGVGGGSVGPAGLFLAGGRL